MPQVPNPLFDNYKKFKLKNPEESVKINPLLCLLCQFDPVEIHNRPTGRLYPRNLGLCMRCYERAVKTHKTSVSNRRTAMNLELDERVVFTF